jgi:hypothetical protein
MQICGSAKAGGSIHKPSKCDSSLTGEIAQTSPGSWEATGGIKPKVRLKLWK